MERACSKGGGFTAIPSICWGEGARTEADAQRYFEFDVKSIEAIGKSAVARWFPERPGISVKLSALHPRFEPMSRRRVLAELTPRIAGLALLAEANDSELLLSMPRRPTGWSFPSRLSIVCWRIRCLRRGPAFFVSRCRPIRSGLWR